MDFTRQRKLPIEHTIGIVLYMAAHGNREGYGISAQNYFSELGRLTGETTPPASHQAISSAKEKIDWQAFRHLLQASNQDQELSAKQFRYQGHTTRAVDGSGLTLPRSPELAEYFDPRSSSAGVGHYPAALLVTAMNVYTGQCKSARVVNHTGSEREQLMSMIESDFTRGDLALLDRGFGGVQVFSHFEKHHQFYLCRMRGSGEKNALYIQAFLRSKKKDCLVYQSVLEEVTGESTVVQIRLIRGPKDSEGKRVVLATNLAGHKKYSRKSLLKLYRHRWTVETMYGRVKNLLKLENFHSKSVNGVMQEIYASLLVISLTALVALTAAAELKLDPDTEVPSFKNVHAVVKRHLFEVILPDRALTMRKARRLVKVLIKEASSIVWKKQPGRSYPRVSKQPIKVWNLAKNKKLREFKNACLRA